MNCFRSDRNQVTLDIALWSENRVKKLQSFSTSPDGKYVDHSAPRRSYWCHLAFLSVGGGWGWDASPRSGPCNHRTDQTFTWGALNPLGELVSSSEWNFRYEAGRRASYSCVLYSLMIPCVQFPCVPKEFEVPHPFLRDTSGGAMTGRVMNVNFKSSKHGGSVRFLFSHHSMNHRNTCWGKLFFILTPKSHNPNRCRAFLVLCSHITATKANKTKKQA